MIALGTVHFVLEYQIKIFIFISINDVLDKYEVSSVCKYLRTFIFSTECFFSFYHSRCREKERGKIIRSDQSIVYHPQNGELKIDGHRLYRKEERKKKAK